MAPQLDRAPLASSRPDAVPGGAGAKGWSIPATLRRVLELLEGLDWSSARVLDVGAGRGAFSQALCARLRERGGLDPRERAFACDAQPESFACAEIACTRVPPSGRLPYPDAHFDAVVSIEVVEHVEDQFAFVRELARVAKPGGLVVITTPNVLHLGSRVRTLLWGFPELFDPLPLVDGDARLCSGHIHPIAPYFLGLAALRAGLEQPRFSGDRTKRSAAAYAILCAPGLWLGQWAHRRRLARKRPELLEQNRELLEAQRSWRMLTSRTAILSSRKPSH